jgi:C4-dicarboxylate-specific signal transduction histidine kinase
MNPQYAAAFAEDRPPLWPNRVAQKGLPPEIEQLLLQAQGMTLSASGDAVQLAERAVHVARDLDDPDLLSRTLFEAATLMREARRPDRAFVLCLEAEPLLDRLDERWRASCVLLLRGNCYLDVGEHERALELITQATERFTSLDDRAQLGRCYTSMAHARALGGDLPEAVKLAEKSLALLDGGTASAKMRRRLQNNEAYWRRALGQQWAEQGDAVRAKAEFERARQSLPALGDIKVNQADRHTAIILDTAISVHIANGDMAAAQRAMKELSRWARNGDNPLEKGLAWLRLADFRVMQGTPLPAIACARRAAAHLEALPLERNRVAAQLLLAQLLEQTGDLKGAYEAHVHASEIEAGQQKEAIALRAELLTLDLEAEQELRKTAQTLEYAQRLSNVGHMVASINHELNQPMSSIKMLAETTIELLGMGQQDEARANIQVMHRLSARLVDLTSKLAAFPAQSAEENPRVKVQHAVAEALSVLSSRLAKTPCEIVHQLPDLEVCAAEGQLVRVLANLLNNALDALEPLPERVIHIEASVEQDKVQLSVSDNGPGIPDSVRERLFQPFFSTKAAGQGLGLGLALSRDVMREMNGDLVAASGASGGAKFLISLPRATSAGSSGVVQAGEL